MPNVGEDWEEPELSSTYGWEYKILQSLWKTVWEFLKKLNTHLLHDLAILRQKKKESMLLQKHAYKYSS
jgi:hypothetical protein